MAKVRVDLRITGQLSNDDAKGFEAAVAAFEASCRAHGLEVRSTGCDVQLDADAPAAGPVAANVDATEEPVA